MTAVPCRGGSSDPPDRRPAPDGRAQNGRSEAIITELERRLQVSRIEMRDTSHVGTAIRFASGAGAGSLIGFWIATSTGTKDVVVFGATVIVAAAMAGVLAARFGRRFWEAFSRLRWFVP